MRLLISTSDCSPNCCSYYRMGSSIQLVGKKRSRWKYVSSVPRTGTWIKVVSVTLPALRDRQCDIPLLIEHFLRTYTHEFGRNLRPLSAKTMTALQRYSWPGNIRELENMIKSYVILGSEDAIRLELLQGENGSNGYGNNGSNGNGSNDGPTSLKVAVRALENRLILRTLEENNWNRRRAAHG